MAPGRSASGSKRKASSSDDEAGPVKKGKNAKGAPDPDDKNGGSNATRPGIAPNGQPTNKVLPVHIEIPKKREGSLRIVTWNVSGLSAAKKKGFDSYVEAEDADILVLTETKVNQAPELPALESRYTHRDWSISKKKGYAGTAVLSKYEPLSVTDSLPGHPNADAVTGRILTFEFEKFYLLATYVTNAGQGLKTLPEKEEWNKYFTKYIRELDAKKPVIWTGDLNVAPTEKDLTHAKRNWNKQPGYTESETKAFARILDPSKEESDAAGKTSANKFIDVWRELHPEDQHYTYFGYRFDCRSKGIGWRLDMFVLSERLRGNVKACEIRNDIYGASDHLPVVLDIDGLI